MKNPDAYLIPPKLIRTYGTRSPFLLAREKGVEIMLRDDFDRQKGAFSLMLNVPFIFINNNLSDEMKRIVCAHELGHALLHRRLLVRRIGVNAENTASDNGMYQLDLFTDYDALKREKAIQGAMLQIRQRYGKNAVVKGLNMLEGATTIERNRQIGGHSAGKTGALDPEPIRNPGT